MNKRLILLLIFVLTMGILVGCSKSIKAPEGVDQEFYDDMVESLNKLAKYKDDDENNGIDKVKYYLDNKLYLYTSKEVDIVELIDDLYFWVRLYGDDEDSRLTIKHKIRELSDLMELDIDVEKYYK